MAMVITVDKPVLFPELKLPCQCHAVRDAYFLQPYGQTAGMVLRWFRDAFCHEEKLKALQTGEDPYDLMTRQAEAVPAGCDGLLMLPHLAGAGSPEYNTEARGVFAGISAGMDKAYFIRAIIESVAFMIRKNLEGFRSTDLRFSEILALGGAAKSKLWNQVISDVAAMPLKSLQVSEAPALGAAILAGTGAGLFKDIEEGITRLVKIKEKFSPQAENRNSYNKTYTKYLELYNQLEKYWEK
jgi:xylulokinase